MKNRDTFQNEILADAAEEEADWFEMNMPGYREKGKCTANVLIENIVEMLISYTAKTWAPNAEKKIMEQIKKVQATIGQIGFEPGTSQELTSTQLTMLISRFKNLFGESFSSTGNTPTMVESMLTLIERTFQDLMLPFSSNKIDYATRKVLFRSQVKDKSLKLLHSVAEILMRFANEAFKETQLPVKLER